uniref:Gasdermin PUB domain-containing protein n=1 Tax=Neovison vison TaxID=452646 RepID=A0A8C7EN82_NEOVI
VLCLNSDAAEPRSPLDTSKSHAQGSAPTTHREIFPARFLHRLLLSPAFDLHRPQSPASHLSPLNTSKAEFEHLQDEIFREMKAVSLLSQDAQDAIFHTILNMLGNQEALQDLMDEVRRSYSYLELTKSGNGGSVGGKILNEMQEDIRDLWIQERFQITYLLEAIMVLSDTQRDLLAQSMKKRILLQQQELVRSILEPNFIYFKDIPFTLKPELLATLQDEDLAITYGLLQECGLNMELNSPSSTWDLEDRQTLSALYGTISLLQRLAVSPERPGPAAVYAGSIPDDLRGPEATTSGVPGSMEPGISTPEGTSRSDRSVSGFKKLSNLIKQYLKI